jgi:hypothetical protein
MTDWIDNEAGPGCKCGCPTVVKITPGGRAVLLCIFHTPEDGLATLLPQSKPDDWMAGQVSVDANEKANV